MLLHWNHYQFLPSSLCACTACGKSWNLSLHLSICLSVHESVHLHPKHFLPAGCTLTTYDRATSTPKNYTVSSDRCFRESRESNSPRLPPFRHTTQQGRNRGDRLNVFLVALNAEIKFRCYFRMIQQQPILCRRCHWKIGISCQCILSICDKCNCDLQWEPGSCWRSHLHLSHSLKGLVEDG